MSSTILIHTPVRGATYFYVIHDILTSYFNPRTHEGCDKKVFFAMIGFDILIHASARDVTAKSHKIGSDFTVLFRKFMQKLGIAIFTISIFLEK